MSLSMTFNAFFSEESIGDAVFCALEGRGSQLFILSAPLASVVYFLWYTSGLGGFPLMDRYRDGGRKAQLRDVSV